MGPEHFVDMDQPSQIIWIGWLYWTWITKPWKKS